jgi:hypothetical protein
MKWEANIKIALRETECEERKWMELTQVHVQG